MKRHEDEKKKKGRREKKMCHKKDNQKISLCVYL